MISIYNILLVIFFSFYFTAFAASENKENIKLLLEQIPEENRQAINQFFKYMFLREKFGYVIFGSKPMTWDGLEIGLLKINLRKPVNAEMITYNTLRHSYSTWKKYEHLFPMKNFILKFFTQEKFSYIDLIFINKKNFLEVTDKNLTLFKKVFGPTVTPEDILHKVLKTENLMSEAMKGSAALTGILLGFGTHNSLVYQSMDDLWNKHWHPPYDFNLMQEVNCIKLTPFPDNLKYPIFIELPFYGEDRNHPESIKIREDYLRTTQIITDIYAKDNFLEILLMVLTSD